MMTRVEEAEAEPVWRDLALIMLVSTLAGAALSLSFPLLSLALSEAGASQAAIGWSAAGHGLGMLVAAPFYAPVIARFGAKVTMCGGLLVFALVLLALPLNVDPHSWFVARFFMGAASAGVFIVTEAAVNAMVSDRNRGRILGLYASFFCVGYASGPLIVIVAGTSGWLPFVIGALIFLAGIPPASQAHGAERVLEGGDKGLALRGLMTAVRLAPLPMITIFTFGFIEMGLMSLLPVYTTGLGARPGEAALFISVWVAGNILLQYPIGWLSDVWSRHGMLIVVMLLSMAMIVPLYVYTPGAIWAWPVALVMGGTLGSLYTLSLSVLGSIFRGAELTIANTAFLMALQAGVMLGPAAGGAVMIAFGDMHLLSLWMALLIFLVTLTTWSATNRRRMKP